ncbi:class II aldolase/adducin family protein [Methylomusa anaerophila]|uniref:L-fuculose phosphate aldolase n=2 Tax=Methylomusa anaerophila TaxID=1930071 RepID=A0A348APS0_9FIRM|nr:class II aldolase/adducin family protein [Methylomusa anaerophila]BBB93068.1 L-fuculose phosphate aldolase [Methylomusa anaerophila]
MKQVIQDSLDSVEYAQKEVLAIGCMLLDKGLVSGTWGNVSTRIPDADCIAVTPSGKPYHELKFENIVIVDKTGNVIRGDFKPTSELSLHLTIYKARPDIKAIVHTHSVFASACAVAHRSIPPIIEDLVQLAGGSIDVAPYALPGTAELALNAVNTLGNKQAVLLANHGVVGCGRSLPEAFIACELVEKAAQIYIHANILGGAKTLSPADVKVMHDLYLNSYQKHP